MSLGNATRQETVNQCHQEDSCSWTDPCSPNYRSAADVPPQGIWPGTHVPVPHWALLFSLSLHPLIASQRLEALETLPGAW